VKERPILFNGAMVRAILSGAKTQTRRVVKPQPFWVNLGDGQLAAPLPKCPFGVVGDRLWVRETWAPFHIGQKHDIACPVDDLDDADGSRYAADGRVWFCSDKGADRPADDGKWTYAAHRWRPSIHMPRWASRLTLTITDVRAQRLQDISEADAVAEGLDGRDLFACTWVNLYGPKSWLTNPWVWAITFTKGTP
jgi:hypothetical protein